MSAIRHRLLLRRDVPTLGASGVVVWIMLNPSTADDTVDDPTIRRCMGFTERFDRGVMLVVNLFTARATDPRELAAMAPNWRNHADADGSIGLALEQAAGAGRGLVVCAWGAHPLAGLRASHAIGMVNRAGLVPQCLGVTKDGHPRHPLYLPADATLVPYAPRSS